ncbi:MAG: DUF402 domain-containing protein [Chloroflexota bacterium]|nr:MAG: DUF402 domain-containing protein [Chloroflexota bacterium]
MDDITIIKCDTQGNETWRYRGKILKRAPDLIVLEALFNRPDTPFYGIMLKQGDRFVETFYRDRWYNIFEIYDRDDQGFKGWYCNIACPAEIDGDRVTYVDLVLDLLVYPDGRQIVLDEDEFNLLRLNIEIQEQARSSLTELQSLFVKKFERQA